MGGGIDVGPAYQRMIDNMCAVPYKTGTPTGSTLTRPGNFVVIRADNDSKYDKYIYDLAMQMQTGSNKLTSVTTIVIQQQISSLSSTDLDVIIPYLNQASAIFITGGDQYFYAVQYASSGGVIVNKLANLIANFNVPTGGTSAGMMMLSPINYIGNPNYGSLTSLAAISNYSNLTPKLYQTILPNNKGDYCPNGFWMFSSLTSNTCINGSSPPYSGQTAFSYFPVLYNNQTATIVDAHFSERDRLGRLIAFMYAFSSNNPSFPNQLSATSTLTNTTSIPNVLGLGINSQTALIIKAFGNAPNSVKNQIEIIRNTSDGGIYLVDARNSNSVSTRNSSLSLNSVQVSKIINGTDAGSITGWDQIKPLNKKTAFTCPEPLTSSWVTCEMGGSGAQTFTYK